MPVPRALLEPALWTVLLLRAAWSFVLRDFICEPLFKAHCKKYGRGLRTGTSIHRVPVVSPQSRDFPPRAAAP